MQEETERYERDFKEQLCAKVSNRIEKCYNQNNQLSPTELKAYQNVQLANELAKLEKIVTASFLFTTGFVVSRLPLVRTIAASSANIPYQKRQQMVLLGRLAKLSAYSLLFACFYLRDQSIQQRCTDEKFNACVEQPLKEGSEKESNCFYKRT